MKILSAVDYGTRTVVQVWMNDTDPMTLHRDGSVHTKRLPTKLADLVSSDNLILIQANPTKLAAYNKILARHKADKSNPLEWCIDCVNNRDVIPVQFEGDMLLEEVEISAEVFAVPATDTTEEILAAPAVIEIQTKTDDKFLTEALEIAAATIPQPTRSLI